jgi:N-acetylglucosamine-6-phosphate deacetylase
VGDGTVLEPGYVCYNSNSGEIVSVSSTAPVKELKTIKCDLLTPGFIDIHLHGIGGSNDLMEFWQTPEYTLSRLA